MQPAELEITGLTHDARGVAHVDGKAAFVGGALPGERVKVAHLHRGKSFDHGQVEQVLRASADRVAVRCAHFGVCAGCSLQHLAPHAQIAAKQEQLLSDLRKFAQCEPEQLLPPLVGLPWGYRRKARLSVKDVLKKGRVLVGFREIDGRYVADIQRCHTLLPAVGERIAELVELVSGLACRREIAQIEVAAGDDETALVFRHLKPLSAGDQAALCAFGAQHQLQIWLQPGGTETVHACYPLGAKLSYQLPEFDVRIAFQPLDFVQVNREINQQMVHQALSLLDLHPGESVLDLYCGLGNFTLPMARRGALVTGVEGDAGLVARARANAEANGLAAQVNYAVADLSLEHKDATWAQLGYDKLLLDPPRAGAAEVWTYLPRSSVRRIVYVSCSPATLARDTQVLVREHGFKLKAAGVMDMFTHTSHVESMALFERS